MTVTIIGIASITLGFLCVLGAYWSFMRNKPRWVPLVLGLFAFVCLTIIPVTGAVFFAA